MTPIMIVAGTRPEVIKLAPIIKWFQRLGIDYTFVWSGQHYDYLLSRIFFDEFELDEPHINLGINSGTHAEQTAEMMLKLEQVFKNYSPSIVVAQGDTNTVLASALTSVKCLIPFAHVEAGLRSWNMRMPEEINRRLADAVASLHFAPTQLAALNILFEGISNNSIYITGNTIVDSLQEFVGRVNEIGDSVLSKFNLEKEKFILVTIHRAENTDNHRRLESIIKALEELSQYYSIVFPIHPRTRNAMARWGLSINSSQLRLMDPLGYFEFLALLLNCKVVLTDSGGVQEEAFTLKVPTVTLRYNTERPETTLYGINVLAGAEKVAIVKTTLMQAERAEQIKKLNFENPLGDGKAGRRIAQILKNAVDSGLTVEEPDLRETPLVGYRLLNEKEIHEYPLLDVLVAFDEQGEPVLHRKSASRFIVRFKTRFY